MAEGECALHSMFGRRVRGEGGMPALRLHRSLQGARTAALQAQPPVPCSSPPPAADLSKPALRREIDCHAAQQRNLRQALHEKCLQIKVHKDGPRLPLATPLTFVRAIDMFEAVLSGEVLREASAPVEDEVAGVLRDSKELIRVSCQNTCQKLFCAVQLQLFFQTLHSPSSSLQMGK
eukprot:Sspe_Gene.59459::Locus_32650_Transcript_1_1_Confidence_1.000_Length_1937::g.59459::m.59459